MFRNQSKPAVAESLTSKPLGDTTLAAVVAVIIAGLCSIATHCQADITHYLPRPARTSAIYAPQKEHRSDTLYLALQTPFGRERFKFTLAQNGSVIPTGVHFVGSSPVRANTEREHRASLSQSGSTIRVFFVSRRTGEPMSAELQLTSPNGTIREPTVKITRVRRYASVPCGDEASLVAEMRTPSTDGLGIYSNQDTTQPSRKSAAADGVTFSPTREVELAAYYDAALARVYGSTSSDYLMATIHAANTLHLAQLGLVIKVKSVAAFDTAIGADEEVEADILLRIFRARVALSGPRPDLHHLFTGARLSGQTVGLAYVAAACLDRGIFATGLSRTVSPALQPIVLSHELGHGLGAYHDQTPASLMSPTLNAQNNTVTPITKNEISQFVEDIGSCIAPPKAVPMSLEVGLVGGRFSASVAVNTAKANKCITVLQTPLIPKANRRASKKESVRWRTIARNGLVSEQTPGRLAVQFSASTPILYRTSQKGYRFRAVARCPGRSLKSPTRTLTPPRADAITTGSFRANDWLSELIRSFRSGA
jgi:hypothetical protein